MLETALQEDVAPSGFKVQAGTDQATNFQLIVQVVGHVDVEGSDIEIQDQIGTKVDLAIYGIADVRSSENIGFDRSVRKRVLQLQRDLDILDACDRFGANRYRDIEQIEFKSFLDPEAFFHIVQFRSEVESLCDGDFKVEPGVRTSPVRVFRYPAF